MDGRSFTFLYIKEESKKKKSERDADASVHTVAIPRAGVCLGILYAV